MKIRSFIIFYIILFVPQIIWAETFHFTAQNATGLNRALGQPLFLFELPNGNIVAPGFDSLGEYNPDDSDPIPLTPETPDSAMLATRVDPNAPFAGQSIDPGLINVPLGAVQTWTSFTPTFDLSTRETLPPHLDAPVFPGVSLAEPNEPEPITLGDWFVADGTMVIKCDDHGNRVRIRVRGLLPHRLYTIWTLWFTPGPQPAIFPQPLGGVPNAYVTDNRGRATYERELNFCPPTVAETGIDGSILISIDTHLHSDHTAYGGIPDPILGGMPPGTVLHGQLSWNMGNGVPFVPDSGDDDGEDEDEDDEEENE